MTIAAEGATHWRPLKAVLGGLVDVPAQLEVSDITLDSRAVVPGAAFLACRGRTHHGLEFARQAVAAGARVILWEPAPGVDAPQFDPEILARPVPGLGRQLGYIADRFFDAPSASLTLAGITGTNGKTTCAWLLAQALQLRGRSAAYVGTLGAGPVDALAPLGHTTPDAITLHRLLAQLRGRGVGTVAMEVSSHALDQERCAGVRFHTAVFTNLTRDHLDYHGDMDAYAAAKARLFEWPTLAARVINVDDPFGADLARRMRTGAQPCVFVTSRLGGERVGGERNFVLADAVHADAAGLTLQLRTSLGNARLESPLRGDFNADNLLTVLAVLLAWEMPLAEACGALALCTAPPGRMQAEGGGDLPLVLIDYAHTPDALGKALQAARAHCTGRLWCVFGCGGERDRGKRAEMGRIAAALADRIVLTDDNPRGEDPRRITDDILAGIPDPEDRARVLHDRDAAIRTAIGAAGAGDVVLVAGKGHETFQLIGAQRRRFSDASAVRAALAGRGVV